MPPKTGNKYEELAHKAHQMAESEVAQGHERIRNPGNLELMYFIM